MDQVLDGKWDVNKNALDDVTAALRRESDVDKLAKLKTRKADLR